MQKKNLNDVRPLAAQRKMNKDRLSQSQYTVSLLNEGRRIGMLSSQDVYHLQSELMMILKDLIWRYTEGESSSVPTEMAENILASILYTVDAYTLSLDDPERAVNDLKTVTIRKFYEKGVDIVRQCFEETKRLYKEIKRNKLDVSVDAYNMTIDESIPVFLKNYGIIFDAHNTMASIDYPLAIDNMRIQGIFYIRQYLERLKLETQFCRFFRQQDLREILVNFGRVCGFDYRIELFNIYELMLNNAVFSILSGGGADQVRISSRQYEQLERLLTHLNASQIRSAIHKAADRLHYELNISDPRMTDYMNQCVGSLVKRVINAANHHSLHTVIITEKVEKPKTIKVSFKESNIMSDSLFRQLVKKMMDCEKTEEKIRLIRTHFHSLQDYIDLLNANCLFGDEFEALYKTFGNVELAILAKKAFYEELRSDTLASFIFREKAHRAEWQIHYITFLQNMSKERLAAIEKYIHDIDYEEIKFD